MEANGSLAEWNEIAMPESDNSEGKQAHIDLRKSRERLFSDFSAGKIKGDFQENYSEIIDQYFRISIQESKAGQELFNKKIPFALVAVGGYGRSELCLFSDIDLLILFRKKIPLDAKNLSEELFYPLWDLGLELGYSVRTISDCLKLGKDDFKVLTSLMDGRFLCGDSLLYLDLMENLQKKVIDKYSLEIIHWLEGRKRLRMNNFGDATHLLEPNLKDGIGGLRDYHHIIWMAKVLYNIRDARELEYLGKLSYREYHELMEEVQFILFVRNHLHQLSKRKNDRLNFEYQEEIAKRLGYKKANKIPPVEQFLGKLHSSMEVIKILHHSFLLGHEVRKQKSKTTVVAKDIPDGLHIIHNELAFNSATAILADPFILMEIFVLSSKHDIPLSMDARRLVKEFLSLIDDEFMRSAKIFNSFLDIINNNNAENTFNQMFDTGFLDAYIPEFGHIRDRVQFDAYHIFPVGRHVLETFYQLKNISKGNDLLLIDTFADLRNHEILFLAALFHDIGKTGKGHAGRGVKITKGIMSRFNYSKETTDEVVFLIENHLFLAETATRRDLDDEKIIIHAARKIETIERLKALYLLTWADSRATGPRAWNEWISNLVQELFFKILRILEMGELATPDISEKINKLKRQLRKLTSDTLNKNEFEYFFEIMSPRYKLITPAAEIMYHYEMVKDLKRQIDNQQPYPFVFRSRENKQGGFWEVSFVSKDRPGLFSDITGVMALNNINILSSYIYTWRDDTAVDVFSVTRPLDTINPDETWNRVKRDLTNTFSGKLALSYRLSKKAVPNIGSLSKRPSSPPGVNIDNKSSDFFTLIETFASDRVGLLYLITRTLFDLRLDIRIAKIGKKGDQIADVFYVRDFDGQKLEDDIQVNEVKMALLHQLRSESHLT